MDNQKQTNQQRSYWKIAAIIAICVALIFAGLYVMEISQKTPKAGKVAAADTARVGSETGNLRGKWSVADICRLCTASSRSTNRR